MIIKASISLSGLGRAYVRYRFRLCVSGHEAWAPSIEFYNIAWVFLLSSTFYHCLLYAFLFARAAFSFLYFCLIPLLLSCYVSPFYLSDIKHGYFFLQYNKIAYKTSILHNIFAGKVSFFPDAFFSSCPFRSIRFAYAICICMRYGNG